MNDSPGILHLTCLVVALANILRKFITINVSTRFLNSSNSDVASLLISSTKQVSNKLKGAAVLLPVHLRVIMVLMSSIVCR